MVKPYECGEVGDEGYPDGLTAELAVEKLKELAGSEQPFFLGVGFFKPHLPFNAPEKYWDLYDEQTIPLTKYDYIPLNVNRASLHNSNEIKQYKLGDEDATLDKPVSEAYARKLVHAYLACVSYVDAQIGKVLDALEANGLAENTVVVIWGDHGWHLGEQRVWGKHTIFEVALNSAFMIRQPGVKGIVSDRVVSSVDIYPTIADLCDVPVEGKMDGTSLRSLIGKKKNKQWQDVAYSYFNNGVTVRTSRYRLTKYYRKAEPVVELYDYRRDPYETENIAGKHPDIVAELMPLLEKGDTGLFRKQ
jgi:arylsulfatase